MKQPNGTNHFQFRSPRLVLRLQTASLVDPRASSTSVMKLFATYLFKRSNLDGFDGREAG